VCHRPGPGGLPLVLRLSEGLGITGQLLAIRFDPLGTACLE
jgi:hypothetical protein